MIQKLDFIDKKKEFLEKYKQKQKFRVAIGRAPWTPYNKFNPRYNLREILDDEIVIEFDSPKKVEEMSKTEFEEFRTLSLSAIHLTGVNLFRAGIKFEVWAHGGISPHIHIHDLPIKQLDKDKRRLFKKLFIRKYVPEEYLKYVDISLTGIHLVRIEYSPCWKGKYKIKELLYSFNPEKKQGCVLSDKLREKLE